MASCSANCFASSADLSSPWRFICLPTCSYWSELLQFGIEESIAIYYPKSGLLPQRPVSVQFGSDFTFIQNWQRLRTKLVRRRAVRLQTDSNSSLGSFILERKCHPFYVLCYRVISIFSSHKLSREGRNLFFSTYIIKFMSRDISFGIVTRLWAE
jgi:hypothetical protein